MQPEARISRRIIQHIMARGGFAYKVHGGPTQMAGIPDISAVYRGVSLWFETKQPGEEPEPIQALRHRQLRAAGAVVTVPHSLAEARAVLDRIDAAVAAKLTPAAISAALNAPAAVTTPTRRAKRLTRVCMIPDCGCSGLAHP